MAIGISDLGNGLGYLYMVDNNDKIIAVKPNSLSGARAMRQQGLANAPMAAQRSAVGQIIVDNCASTGNITAITINGINIIATFGNIACATSVEATFAGVIAAAINASPAASGPIYTATAFEETVSLFSDPADGSSVNGYTIIVAVSSGTIQTRTTPFTNGSDQSGVYDSVLGYRFYIDANYNGTATPTNFATNGVEVTQYFTLRGLQAGIFTTEQTIDTDRIAFERDCAITQVILFNQGAASSDVLAFIDPSDFIDGDEVILVPGDSAQVPIVEDATVTTSPIPSKNIYLTDAQPFSLSNNKSISLRFKYDSVLGPIFIESGRSIAVPPAGLISTTRTALVATVNASGLAPGSFYLITDRGDAGLIVQATSSNALSLQGTFIARVPDYQNTTGNFIRTWYSVMAAPTVNKLVAYNGYHYRSLTGAVGTAPSGDAVNWLQLAKTDSSYITEYQYCEYDYANDWVQKRVDSRANSVSCSFQYFTEAASGDLVAQFKWGSDNVYGNDISESVFECYNYAGFIKQNKIGGHSFLQLKTNSVINTFVMNNFYNQFFMTNSFIENCNYNTIFGGSISGVGSAANPLYNFENNNLFNPNFNAITIAGTASCTQFAFNRGKISITNCTLTGSNPSKKTLFYDNFFDNALIDNTTFTSAGEFVGLYGTTMKSNTVIQNSTINGYISKCTLSEYVVFDTVTQNTLVTLSECVFGVNITGETFSSDITGKYCDKVVSNFVATLSAATVIAAGVLTIPTSKSYCGLVNITGATSEVVTKVVNLPGNYDVWITPVSSQFTMSPTPVATAIADQIVSDAGNLLLVGRTDGSDAYCLRKDGIFNKKINAVKLL